TEQISVPSYGYDYRDLRQIRGIHKQFGKVKLKTFPQMGFFKSLYYQKVRGITSISPLNYMPYNKAKAIQILESELGWRYYGGKHYESIITRFHQAYILINKFRVDKRKAHLSNLIYSGQITREEALEELRKELCPPDMLAGDREYVIKKLGLTESEFEEIMAAPPRSYRDYPNEEWLYRSYALLARRTKPLRTTLAIRRRRHLLESGLQSKPSTELD
ncbi:MAG: N-acetyl sugar amidotransferase, partial [Chloroflexi bacterium]|nr:N-acetyl sugar amidotransferase [Chloroflexota bacterium]